jgi:CheY-like chemotaxis protein
MAGAPAQAVPLMKTSPSVARILVATNNADDARQIVRQLQSVFDNVRSSTVAAAAVTDFESYQPDVLVLAFDTIEKSQSHYLGLYRLGSDAMQAPHRTLILCSKDEVRAAFDLCLKDYFDDYVLYWPQSYDGNRLPMSVWNACRQMMALHDALPGRSELIAHAKHLAELERVLADPLHLSASDVRDGMGPALLGTRPLAEAVRKLRHVVMVVDDDEFARGLVTQALDPERWEVVPAVDGVSALRHLRQTQPDVILMDIRLPGMDGVALTRHLKGSPRMSQIPIVMMTGDARRETLVTSMEAGAADFVVKPVSRAALEAKLHKLLDLPI